jgi:translation initiation factor 2 beta subunit (eIF-2beta)/eIF-5
LNDKVNWIAEAKRVFKAEKPKYFTNYQYCEECAEHDKTLIHSDIDIIGLTKKS